MRNKYLFLLLSFIFIFALAGCSDLTSAQPAAESAVVDFHNSYNAKQYKSIFDAAHDDFKKATDFDSFSEFMEAVHSKLGNMVSSENQTWNAKSFNFTTTMVLQQKTAFEKGEGIETFTYRIEDKKAVLLGYNINSRDLIVN